MGLSQKSLTQIANFFLFRVPMNPQTDWKAKLDRDRFFKDRSDRITVWLNKIGNENSHLSNDVVSGTKREKSSISVLQKYLICYEIGMELLKRHEPIYYEVPQNRPQKIGLRIFKKSHFRTIT